MKVNKIAIINNAGVMYGRMLLLILSNLYFSRIALDYLGQEKFGLISVVTGIVIIGVFLSSVLEMTAQRYISEAITKKESWYLKNTIQSIMYVFTFVMLLSIVVVEIVGILYVNAYLNQSVVSNSEVNLLFQLSVLLFVVSSMSSILLAILISFGKVKVYTFVTLLEVLFKIGFIKFAPLPEESVIYYALMLFLSVSISRFLAYTYVRKSVPSISFTPKKDPEFIRNLFYFVKWNLIGGFASIATIQGLNVVVNMFFGLTVNAARAIATQLYLAILQMINSVQLAFNPKIVEFYSENDTRLLNETFKLNSKLTAISTALVIIFLTSHLKYILLIWLGDYNHILISFIYLMLFELYIVSFTGPLLSIIQASERIKRYQIVVGGTMMLNLPLCVALIKYIDNPLIIYYVPIFISLLTFMQRIYFVSKLNVVDIGYFVRNVFIRVTAFIAAVTMLRLIVMKTPYSINYIYIEWLVVAVLLPIICLTIEENKFIVKKLKKNLKSRYLN